MRLHEIFAVNEMGPNMQDPNSVEEWKTRYQTIIDTSSSDNEKAMASKLLAKIDSAQTERRTGNPFRKVRYPAWQRNAPVTEAFLTELGPDLNNKRSVDEWIERYTRIWKTSDGIGEREMAKKLLDALLAKIGRKVRPDRPEQPEQPKAKPTGTGVSTNVFKVVFFGHFYDPMAGKRGSDKVWGWGVYGDEIFWFWGANGKQPRVKRLPNTPENRQEMENKAMKKARKGYNKIKASDHVEWLKRVLDANPI